MSEPTTQTIAMSASNRILKLLTALSATPTGNKVYSHIRHNLEQIEYGRLESEQAYFDLINTLLDAATRAFPNSSHQHIELQLMRLSLVPGMAIDELKVLGSQLEQIMVDEQSPQTTSFDSDFLERALKPLLSAKNNAQALVLPQTPHAQNEEEAPHTDHSTTEPQQIRSQPTKAAPAPQIDIAYQNQLDQTRESIQTIQNQLGEQIVASMQLNDELASLFKNTLEALEQLDNSEGLDTMRSAYKMRSNELVRRHQHLVTQFDVTYNKLHIIESSGQRLDDELSNLHRLSLTDELTELPNRRAILQRIENEVARSRRYNTPLALALIDLDKFKSINDQYGHAAGDTVLNCFATEVLSVFRNHDTAARYGGEEFAILMPSTDIDGAFKALEKIRHIAKQSNCALDTGEEIAMPTFSAGIALYTADETPEELLNRADTAMYRAKQMGRSRIEVHSTGTKIPSNINVDDATR